MHIIHTDCKCLKSLKINESSQSCDKYKYFEYNNNNNDNNNNNNVIYNRTQLTYKNYPETERDGERSELYIS